MFSNKLTIAALLAVTSSALFFFEAATVATKVSITSPVSGSKIQSGQLLQGDCRPGFPVTVTARGMVDALVDCVNSKYSLPLRFDSSVGGRTVTVYVLQMNGKVQLSRVYAPYTILDGAAPVPTPVPVPVPVPPPVNPVPPTPEFGLWMEKLNSQRASTASYEAGDLRETWTGADGESSGLTVKAPKILNSVTVTLPLVPAGEDARPYFAKAIESVRTLKASKLVIPKGTYVFKTLEPGDIGHLEFYSFSDLTVEGNGSTLVFTKNAIGLKLRELKRVKFSNFIIESSLHTHSLGRIELRGTQKVLVIDAEFPVTADDKVHQLVEYDATAASPWTQGGVMNVIEPGVDNQAVFAGNQTYTSSRFSWMTVGQRVLVYHYWYGGTTVFMSDGNTRPSQSEDLWFDKLTIYSGPGMGFVAAGLKRGLALTNSTVTVKPGSRDRASLLFDAVHLISVGGDILLKNNLFEHEGDDAVNFATDNQVVQAVNKASSTIDVNNYANYVISGMEIGYFDTVGNFLGSATVKGSPVNLGGDKFRVTVDSIPSSLAVNHFVRLLAYGQSRYAVLGNTFQKNKAHGLIAQSAHGLIQGNTFKHMKRNGLHLITSARWKEGFGGVNVVIQKNTFENMGVDEIPGVIALYGEGLVNKQVNAAPSMGTVLINQNTVVGAKQSCISIASSFDVTVSNNSCQATNTLVPGASIDISKSTYVQLLGNSRSGASTGVIKVDAATTDEVSSQDQY